MNIKLIFIGLVTLLLVSCETKEWKQNDITLVPVYQVNDIASNLALEIYQEKDLLLEYTNSILLSAYEMAAYNDASTDSLYTITFSRTDSLAIADVMTQVEKNFNITANMSTDTGIMNIVYLHNTVDTVAVQNYDITILDTEVYN